MNKLSKWFYEFKHGHPFLLTEETDIILDTRLNDPKCEWMNDHQIQKIIDLKIKAMYRKKFPKAKKWTLPKIN